MNPAVAAAQMSFALEMMFSWFVLFNILMYLYLLFFLDLIKSFYSHIRTLKVLSKFIGFTGTCLLLAGIIRLFEKNVTFKMMVIVMTGLVAVSIIYTFYH